MKAKRTWLGLALAVLAALAVGGLVAPPGGADEQQLEEVKDGEVSNQGEQAKDIDYDDEEPVSPESVTPVGETVTIVSKMMTPPGDMAFKDFPSPNPWQFVDIETDPDAPPGSADTDTASAIQISVEGVPETAGDCPLKGEGNLKPPGGGGGGPQEWHWSAKISEFVIFNPNPVKTGYALKDDGTLDPKKIKQTVTATFRPKSLAADAKIVVDDPNGRIEPIAEGDLTRNAGAGTIMFDVYGKTMTPVNQPNGDATIKATKADNTPLKGEAKVIVVIPSTQVHAKVGCVLVNKAVNLPNDKFELSTRAFGYIDIQVKDQFGNPLDAVYNGNKVVVEEFVNRQGDEFGWPGKGPIEEPDPALANGLKHDVASDRCVTESPGQLSPEQILAWENFELLLGGKDNCFALNGQQLESSAGQKIWVWGHELSNIVTRTITEKPVNREDVPFDVEDE